jgi:hypothetical protein
MIERWTECLTELKRNFESCTNSMQFYWSQIWNVLPTSDRGYDGIQFSDYFSFKNTCICLRYQVRGSDDARLCLLGCDVMWSCGWLVTFRIHILIIIILTHFYPEDGVGTLLIPLWDVNFQDPNTTHAYDEHLYWNVCKCFDLEYKVFIKLTS